MRPTQRKHPFYPKLCATSYFLPFFVLAAFPFIPFILPVQPDSCPISASLSPSSTSTTRPPHTHPRGPQASSRRFESRQPTLIPRFQKGFGLETLSVIFALTVLFLYL
ncbi:hypothetical protein ACFX2I_040438 [Malus domestica]